MRLIDADALKEDLRRFFPVEVLEGIEPKTLFAQIMHDIDNAPTIETKECPYSCEKCAKKMICELGKEMGRPQGEWIGGDKVVYHGNLAVSGCWHCNRCGALAGVERNFCGRCGADMRKGGAE